MNLENPYDLADEKNQVLRREFAKETDRGALIMAAALFDEAVLALLKARLVVDPKSDKLFAPQVCSAHMALESKEMAHRVGAISKQRLADLTTIGEIRNRFAHHILDATFDAPWVKQKVDSLCGEWNPPRRYPPVRATFEQGTRGDFRRSRSGCFTRSTWMLTIRTSSSSALWSLRIT